MNASWQHLSRRERWIIIAGSLLVVIALLYTFLWLPLSDAATRALQKTDSQIQLLEWMQRADRRIEIARANGIELDSTKTPILLTTVESAYSACHLSDSIQSVQQPKHNKVSLSLHQVPFDRFIDCTHQLLRREGLAAQHLKVMATATAGLVNVEITIIQ